MFYKEIGQVGHNLPAQWVESLFSHLLESGQDTRQVVVVFFRSFPLLGAAERIGGLIHAVQQVIADFLVGEGQFRDLLFCISSGRKFFKLPISGIFVGDDVVYSVDGRAVVSDECLEQMGFRIFILILGGDPECVRDEFAHGIYSCQINACG